MHCKLISFWHEKQKVERFSSAQWLAMTKDIENLTRRYPYYETYGYSFTDQYTKTEQVSEYGICTKLPLPEISPEQEVLSGKWLNFLAKRAFLEKLPLIVQRLLAKDLITQLKFRSYPICNEENPGDLINNFIIIAHEPIYTPHSAQKKVFTDFGLSPIFRFDLETKLDMIAFHPQLSYTYNTLEVQTFWLEQLSKQKAHLQQHGEQNLQDLTRAIQKVAQNILVLKSKTNR